MVGEDRRIPVKYHVREGETTPVGRFEFPYIDFIYAILESTPVQEQKKYRLYFFKNILVVGNYSKDVHAFLRGGAQKAGFDLEFVERKVEEKPEDGQTG